MNGTEEAFEIERDTSVTLVCPWCREPISMFSEREDTLTLGDVIKAASAHDCDEQQCPVHGPVLEYHEDQGDEYEVREHLQCSVPGCEYEVWAS